MRVFLKIFELGRAVNLFDNMAVDRGSSAGQLHRTTMTVEDAVEILDQHAKHGLFTSHHTDEWARGFVHNVASYTRRGAPLSTMQARIVLNLLKRVKQFLVDAGANCETIDRTLGRPTYRQEPYTSTPTPREVRHVGDNLLGFRFKRNDAVLLDLRAACDGLGTLGTQTLWFDRTYKVWIAPVTRNTIKPLMDVIGKHRFAFDDAVAAYLACADTVRGLPAAVVTDRQQGVIAAQVYDDEITAFFIGTVLGGEPA